MKIASIKKLVCLSKLPCPTDCIHLILDFSFKHFDTCKQAILNRILNILKSGYSRTNVFKKFYEIWNDADQDSFWIHVYNDSKQIVLQNENCVRCGNFRDNHCNKYCICYCGFVEMYEELR